MEDYYFYIKMIGSEMLGSWNVRLGRGLTCQLVYPTSPEIHRGKNCGPVQGKELPKVKQLIPESKLGPNSPFHSLFTRLAASIGKQAFKNNH